MEATYVQQTALFKALAHPVRLRILELLACQDEACVCHLIALLRRRQAYVSQQLMVLRRAGLVDTREDGLLVYYRLRNGGVRELLAAAQTTLGRPALAQIPPVAPGCTCPACRSRQ